MSSTQLRVPRALQDGVDVLRCRTLLVGAVARPASTMAWSTRSYSVITLSRCGANLGGATITQAPSTAGVALVARSLMVAVTGPSETSSYQSVVAPEVDRSPLPLGRGRLAEAAQHQQVVLVVAADLAERHGRPAWHRRS